MNNRNFHRLWTSEKVRYIPTVKRSDAADADERPGDNGSVVGDSIESPAHTLSSSEPGRWHKGAVYKKPATGQGVSIDHNKDMEFQSLLNKINFLSKTYFLKQLHLEKRRAERSKSSLSVVLVRFSGEKNDSFDDVQEFLKFLQNRIRETDFLGYLGEDIISILLPGANEDGVQQFIKKIINEYKNSSFAITTGTYPDQLFNSLLIENPGPSDFYSFFHDFKVPDQSGYLLKRSLDIAGSLIGLLLFSPLMLITALAIKVTSPGPIIFKQLRLGQSGVPFVFYKFRSMYQNADNRIHKEYVANLIQGNFERVNQGEKEKPFYKIKRDPRITRVGKIIRKTSIDELPQLFNVLRGEMSLVGPRPPLPYEAAKYQSWHLRRVLETKPGITGLWQIGGRSEISFEDMVRLDIRYIRRCSLMLDLKILIKTVKVVLQFRGTV